jgi:hypothetical protein
MTQLDPQVIEWMRLVVDESGAPTCLCPAPTRTACNTLHYSALLCTTLSSRIGSSRLIL